ncbi:MAG TPA: hypothetical protein VNK04_21235 [Gemmataceae bacterium]|jgi:hypothetical protein|nr:hypothetical protein [Gemmataceae bacterium]
MLTIRFDPLFGDSHIVGPAPYFRIVDGITLRAGPNDEEVATYANGSWRVGNRYFTVFTTQSPTLIRFESAGQPCAASRGPFRHAQVVDGAIRDGAAPNGLLAHLDEQSRTWYVYPDQVACQTVVFEPAPAAS